MIPTTIHQIGIAFVSYNKTDKEWETESSATGIISYPAGKEGEAAAQWKAIELSNPLLYILLQRMVSRYPHLKSRACKMGELVLAGKVFPVPDPPDDGLIAIVESRTEEDTAHEITFDGYHFRCDCDDYWRENAPRVRWHSQRTCIHIGALQAYQKLVSTETQDDYVLTEMEYA